MIITLFSGQRIQTDAEKLQEDLSFYTYGINSDINHRM